MQNTYPSPVSLHLFLTAIQITLGDGGSQRGLAVVNMPNGAHIDVGLLPHKGLAGVPLLRDGQHSQVGACGCLLQLGEK